VTTASRRRPSPHAVTEVPTGEELFVGVPSPLVEAAADRYCRKPSGTSDQGYAEDPD